MQACRTCETLCLQMRAESIQGGHWCRPESVAEVQCQAVISACMHLPLPARILLWAYDRSLARPASAQSGVCKKAVHKQMSDVCRHLHTRRTCAARACWRRWRSRRSSRPSSLCHTVHSAMPGWDPGLVLSDGSDQHRQRCASTRQVCNRKQSCCKCSTCCKWTLPRWSMPSPWGR